MKSNRNSVSKRSKRVSFTADEVIESQTSDNVSDDSSQKHDSDKVKPIDKQAHKVPAQFKILKRENPIEAK